MRARVGVLISGNGSTLQALLDCRDLCDITVVISSREKAYGLKRARRAGVPTLVIPRGESESWILTQLEKYRVQKVFLAGFMKIVSKDFIKKYEGQIFNIHPSLLPKYKGLHAFEEALKAKDLQAGVTVHHVAEEVDSGEYIQQRVFDIPASRSETLSSLWLHIQEQRVLRDSFRKVLCLRPQM